MSMKAIGSTGLAYLWEKIKNLLATGLSGKADKATTLAGYGITDALNTSSTAQTKNGQLTATKFVTSGGGSSQVVAGDGSLKTVDSAVSNTSTNLVQNKAIVDYIVSRDENLVTNGFASLGTNYNFTGLTLDTTDTYVGGGSFCITNSTNTTMETVEFMPVDIFKSYKLQYYVKNTYETSTYDMLIMCDIDKRMIYTSSTMYIAGTLTTLAQDLKNGDTVVYLTDTSNWYVDTSASHRRGFIFWNYKNSGGYQYPAETYSQNVWLNLWDADSDAIDFENNTITLNAAWSHGTFEAGTQLSQSNSGGTYVYGNSAYKPTAGEWTLKSYTFTPSKFRAATAYVRIGWLVNYTKVTDNTFAVCGISLTSCAQLTDLDSKNGSYYSN